MPQPEHPADADRVTRLPGQRHGQQGSDAAAVLAALYPARVDAMSVPSKKLRLGPLLDTQAVKLAFACPARLKADLDRYAALHTQPTARRSMPWR